jgi:hypothetical protein
VVVRDFLGTGFDGVPVVVLGRRLVPGPGVACPKSWHTGCELAALDAESFPGCPPGPLAGETATVRASIRRRAKMASLIFALETAERFLVGLSLGQLLVVIRATLAVPVPDLGDRSHVDRVVDAPVAA